jgi:hypothetical protein
LIATSFSKGFEAAASAMMERSAFDCTDVNQKGRMDGSTHTIRYANASASTSGKHRLQANG